MCVTASLTQESELPEDHAAQEPLLLLRAQLGPHPHLPRGGGQKPRRGGQEPGEFGRFSECVCLGEISVVCLLASIGLD